MESQKGNWYQHQIGQVTHFSQLLTFWLFNFIIIFILSSNPNLYKIMSTKACQGNRKETNNNSAAYELRKMYWNLRKLVTPTPTLFMLNYFIFAYFTNDIKQIEIQMQAIKRLFTKYLQNSGIDLQWKSQLQQLSLTNFGLAIILDHSHDPSAGRHYQTAHQLDQNNAQICLFFAWFLFQKGKIKSAINYANKIKLQNFINIEHNFSIEIFLTLKLFQFKQNTLNRNSSNEFEILKVEFIFRLCQFATEFYQHKIENEEAINYQHFYYLVYFLSILQRKDECLKWIQILQACDPKESYDLEALGLIFRFNEMFEESIPYLKKAIEINPENEMTYQYLIHSLIELKKFDEAKYYAIKLQNINKHNHQVFSTIGLTLSYEGRHTQAVEYLRASVSLKQDKDTYFQLGQSLYNLGRNFEAKQCLIRSIRIQPNIQAYRILLFCIQNLGNKLSAIGCCEEIILFDYTSLLPFINLSDYAQQNKTFKQSINCFMDAISQKHASNLHVEFNVALYYYLSKQSHSRFHELILRCMKGNKEENQQNIWEDIVFSALKEYQYFTLSFKNQNPIFSMIIGILSRVKERNAQSQQCFLNLFNFKNQTPNQSYSEVFDRIYFTLLIKMKDCSLFLEWMTIEMLQKSPKEALRCHFKALNYCKGHYDNFKLCFSLKIYEQIEIGCQFAQETIIEINGKAQRESQQINIDNKSIFDIRKFHFKLMELGLVLNSSRQIIHNSYPFKITQFIHKYFFCDQQRLWHLGGTLSSTIIGIKWEDSNISNYSFHYKQLLQLIGQSQQRIIGNIGKIASLFRDEDNKMGFLYEIILLIEDYFEKEFAANQTIKMIYNGLLPFIPFNAESHNLFAFILAKFKMSYSFSSLQDGLKEIFAPKYQQSNVFEESEMTSITQGISEEEAEKTEMHVYVRQDTQSQFDTSDEQSQFFILKNKEKPRKFSDSNVSSITTEEYEKFIESITAMREENVLKVIAVPFQNYQDSELISCMEQKSDEEERQWDKKDAEEEEDLSDLCSEIMDQQSEFAQDNSQSDKATFYKLSYSINNIKFEEGRKYTKFRQIMFRNTYYILGYISKKNDKKHIAKHQLNHVNIKRVQEFNAEVESGAGVQCPYASQDLQEKTLQWIWFLGKEYVLQWICDTAKGIAELQKLGIYHADLAIRNTILIKHKWSSKFKIIDFDKAFKVIKTEQKDKCFECTQQLINFWLQSRFDSENMRPSLSQISIFDCSEDGSSENLSKNKYEQTDIIRHLFSEANEAEINELLFIKNDAPFSSKRSQKCLKKLRDFTAVGHGRQFVKLVRMLLDGEIGRHCNQGIIDSKLISSILVEVENYAGVDYWQLATKVKEMTRLEQDCINQQ